MIPTFILFFREGLEASLIVSILLAALRQLGQTQQQRAVWIGVGLAIVGALLGGIAIYFTVRAYDNTRFQTIFETITYIAAVVILTGMTFWMQRHSRSLKGEIVAKVSAGGSGFALGLLAFTTVGREGLETAVFTLALGFQTSGALLVLGGALGIMAALALSFMIYRLGYQLDYRIFFRVMGVLLLFFAAGLLGDAVQNLQQLGWITFGTTHLWDTSQVLREDSTVGDLLHTLLGYAESPTALQATLYLIYLAVAGTFFVRLTRKPTRPAPAVRPATPQAEPTQAA